jgi:alpha-glucosidase
MLSAFGEGENRVNQAKIHLLLLLTLKGTPFLYNGEEIGMSDLLITDAAQFRDPLSRMYYEMDKKVNGSDEQTALHRGALMGRDRNRTPMQWSNSPNAGFCPAGVQPWLPVNPDYQQGINVKDEMGEPGSMINFYRRALTLRRQFQAFQVGEFQDVATTNPDVLVYFRTLTDQRLMVVLNLTGSTQKVILPCKVTQILLNTHKNWVHIEDSSPEFLPYQGVVYAVGSQGS